MNRNILNTNSGIYLGYGYLMLPLNLNISSKIEIENKTFFPKKGYHVSLICLENLPKPNQEKILNFAKKYPVVLKRMTGVYRLVIQENNQSIIVRIHLKGLKKLITAVNKHFGYSLVYPPTHITLFTLKGQYGIAINSNSEYRQLTHQISPKDSLRLAKSFKLI